MWDAGVRDLLTWQKGQRLREKLRPGLNIMQRSCLCESHRKNIREVPEMGQMLSTTLILSQSSDILISPSSPLTQIVKKHLHRLDRCWEFNIHVHHIGL